MSRLIDADYVLKALGIFNNKQNGNEHFLNGIETAREIVQDAPTIEAEPVRHGHWEMKEDPYMFFSEIPTCSVCGCIPKMRNKTAYCSNCGAHMDEVSE